MLILLVMPIVLICLFGFAITTEVKNTRVCVVDGMCDENSQRIVTQVDANECGMVVECKRGCSFQFKDAIMKSVIRSHGILDMHPFCTKCLWKTSPMELSVNW